MEAWDQSLQDIHLVRNSVDNEQDLHAASSESPTSKMHNSSLVVLPSYIQKS